jgi:hypothetical protein
MFGLLGRQVREWSIKIARIGQNDAQRSHSGLNRALFSSDHGLGACGPRLAPINGECLEMEQGVRRATNNPGLEDEGTDETVAGKIQKKVGDSDKVFET